MKGLILIKCDSLMLKLLRERKFQNLVLETLAQLEYLLFTFPPSSVG